MNNDVLCPNRLSILTDPPPSKSILIPQVVTLVLPQIRKVKWTSPPSSP